MSIQPQVSPIVARRIKHFRRGINLSHWFSQVDPANGYIASHFDSWISGKDFALIKAMGFDHVRFPIAPEPILNERSPSELPSEYIGKLDRNIQAMLDIDLAVIIDIHPNVAFKGGLATSDEKVAVFVSFWEALASHFSKFDPERVCFEVLNEPEIRNPKRWNAIQNEAAQSIRGSAPAHTLVIGGDECSQLPMLLLLEPPADPNIICNFHLYDPIVFSHQGANWAPPWAMACEGMTYPVDPDFIQDFLRNVSDPDAVRKIKEYERQNWGVVRYQEMAGQAAEWGRAHGFAISCNEFGVYKVFAPRPSRLLWVRDVVGALEKNHIVWTMWDYAGDFEVVRNKNGDRIPDDDLLGALGLIPNVGAA
ncbi:MAG TPA: cellulase family glycosylhydrolase [Candidatus Methylacidiphilales bacterium]